jgi:hypothetical protein
MSSKVTGDAQPDANAPIDTDHTLPTEIVENSARAGAVTVPDNAENTRPTEESQSTPEAVAESATDGPTEVTDSSELAEGAELAEPPATGSADPAEATETAAETPADPAAEPAPGEDDAEDLAELENPAEPAELIAMTELIELAEPVEDPAPRRRLRGLLIAFVFLLAGAAIVAGAIAIVGSLTHGFKKPVVIHYKKSAIFALKTGQCIDPNGQQAATVVSCNTPHDAEVFAIFSLSGAKWPGTAAASATASSGCSTRLTGYLNPQLAINLKSTYIYPGQVAWEAGTRTVICEVQASSGQLTGSVRGASATAS